MGTGRAAGRNDRTPRQQLAPRARAGSGGSLRAIHQTALHWLVGGALSTPRELRKQNRKRGTAVSLVSLERAKRCVAVTRVGRVVQSRTRKTLSPKRFCRESDLLPSVSSIRLFCSNLISIKGLRRKPHLGQSVPVVQSSLRNSFLRNKIWHSVGLCGLFGRYAQLTIQ